MSEAADTSSSADAVGTEDGRHLPVLVTPEARAVERPSAVAVSRTVAAATGGFLAGVGTLLLMRLLRRPRLGRVAGTRTGGLRRRRGHEVATTRSFLVDVHLLRR